MAFFKFHFNNYGEHGFTRKSSQNNKFLNPCLSMFSAVKNELLKKLKFSIVVNSTCYFSIIVSISSLMFLFLN
jgi:hypothetical protein